ncbi:MAG: bifunctional UDP-N-acetylmuramoyl-tripeptide:D-alanyl-D-alanine ligase/alanine racemase [Muribaculaceae bacterium]|nr:bifunctional UDP-N-acetylmuramoyl-tripeptide:D-alanyl-D-alanine ligase/alanine racemase [Muribaculaceae bacterium]
MEYSIKEIAEILNLSTAEINDCKIENLLTDSRSLTYPESTLFFALHTANNDGHLFISPLYAAGVKNFVIEKGARIPMEAQDANFLEVDSPLRALQQLASYHRSQFAIPVIGITGSRGKTTVKEWLYQLLQEDYNIVRSPRSYNSQIGVPLSIWEMEENTNLAILEAGISTVNEMSALKSIIRPTIGIITNLNGEHQDGFSSLEQKCEEKCQLLSQCECVVYNADNKLISDTVKSSPSVQQELSWSRKDGDRPLFISSIEKKVTYSHLCYSYLGVKHEMILPFISDVDIENALHCLAVLLYLHVDEAVIAKRMSALAKVGTRIDVIEGVNHCLIISDSYTSDYNSLSPALDFMARRMTKERTSTVILSDVMHESYSGAALYKKIANLLRTRNIERFIGIGENFVKYQAYFGANSQFYNTTREFLNVCSSSDFEDEQILIKGTPEYNFKEIVDMLEAKQHETVLEVNLDAVAHNYNFFRSKLKPETRIVCMVKASGYGAGAYELAKTLQDRGAGYLAVAVLDEGVDLRKAGITMPIMVLNPRVVNYKALFSYNLEPEIFSLDICKEIIKEAEKFGITNFPVHIKLDTGMHRLGFLKEQLPELLELLKSQNAIVPRSVFSHLAVADEPGNEMDKYTMQQFKYFDECCNILQSGTPTKILRHILNTAGIIRFPEHQFDMVRLGIGLYGIKTLNDGSEDTLKHVSSLNTVIISIKEWDEGITIGYGRRGKITRKSRIATIPIGYADGLDRHLGNEHSKVYVNGYMCPIIGNICMDACMVDVTDAECRVGDSVEIFGDHIPVSDLSDILGTIPYEILTSISNRVKRVYYRE